jgi:hypothetical protein
MNEETNPKAGTPVEGQLSEILLVLDKEQKKIKAVTGIDNDGELKTTDVTKKNQNQFMNIDLRGDIFTNFFSNFFRQLKDPTRFTFFKVPVATAIETAEKIQKQIDKPDKKNEKILRDHEVKLEPDNKKDQQQNKNMETKQTVPGGPENSEYRFKKEQIDWQTLSDLGLSKEYLEQKQLLEPLLKGYKTNEMVAVNVNLGTAIIRSDARLSLQENADGKVVMAIHGIRKEPKLDYPFFGHEFTKEDKENLLKTGNMGRVVELTNPKTQEKHPSVISVDRMTNELVALRADWIKIPDEIKGVKLNDEQKQILQEGKPLFIEGMISKKNEPFDATVQFNADKRFVEFLFDRTERNKLTPKQEQGHPTEAPKTFRGKELDEEQYSKFKKGETIHVDGLVDKKGKSYQGYITFNKDTNTTEFSFKNPNKLKEQIQPAEANKTQVAVNSEGKTNEATKKINEPLKTGQQSPDNSKQKEEQEKKEQPAKSKGVKM